MPIIARVVNALSWGIALAFVIRLALAWNSLPDQVAAHFTRAGDPDLFISRAALAIQASGAVLVAPVLATFMRFDRFGHAFLFGTTVILTIAFWMVVDFNVNGRPISSAPAILGAGSVAAVAAFLILGRAASASTPSTRSE